MRTKIKVVPRRNTQLEENFPIASNPTEVNYNTMYYVNFRD